MKKIFLISAVLFGFGYVVLVNYLSNKEITEFKTERAEYSATMIDLWQIK